MMPAPARGNVESVPLFSGHLGDHSGTLPDHRMLVSAKSSTLAVYVPAFVLIRQPNHPVPEPSTALSVVTPCHVSGSSVTAPSHALTMMYGPSARAFPQTFVPAE